MWCLGRPRSQTHSFPLPYHHQQCHELCKQPREGSGRLARCFSLILFKLVQCDSLLLLFLAIRVQLSSQFRDMEDEEHHHDPSLLLGLGQWTWLGKWICTRVYAFSMIRSDASHAAFVAVWTPSNKTARQSSCQSQAGFVRFAHFCQGSLHASQEVCMNSGYGKRQNCANLWCT